MQIINLKWSQVDGLVNSVVKQIHKKYDVIIGVNRGGLVPGVLMSHRMNVRHGVTTIESYQGKRKSRKHKIDYHVSMIGQLSPKTRILLVDDIADSGKSLVETIAVLEKLGCPKKNIDTATLHYKHTSCFKPTYFAKQVKEYDWINYPWERK